VVGIARSEQMTVEGGAALTDAWIDDRPEALPKTGARVTVR
jgi:hypothetical protein